MTGTPSAYGPLDTPKPVAEDIWIVNSGPHRVMGIPIPVRMTVIRLRDGSLLLHSPTRFTEPLHEALRALGPIRHIVAPNSAHWAYVRAWQVPCPEAVTWAAPGLRERRQVRDSGTRIDNVLSNTAPDEWREDIDQLVVRGGFGFREVAFMHRKSRTLVLTDLVVNVPPEQLPLLARQGARLVGSTAPDGRAPLYLRLTVRRGGEAARAAGRRLVHWKPERVIFSHGDWFDSDATPRLARSLDWLTA